MKILKRLSNYLKGFGKKSPPVVFTISEEELVKLQNSVKALEYFAQTTAKVILSHVDRFDKNSKFNEAAFNLISDQEEDLKELKAIITQHADIINGIQKHLFGEDFDKKSEQESDIDNQLKKINERKN